MTSDLDQAWATFGTLTSALYAVGDGAETFRGSGWFAALSRTDNTELNVCGLLPRATASSAEALLAAIGDQQPCLVFTSEHAPEAARRILTESGFVIADTREPLMRCANPPTPATPDPSPFAIARAASDAEIGLALELTADAHQVDRALLDVTLGAAARKGLAHVWLARSGGQAVSTVWLNKAGNTIGVMEMMTPRVHQGRGAGRAVLATALAQTWTAETEDALLLATPAGRRLYQSLGFVAVDEGITCHRGMEDCVLDAIGQPS